MSMLKTEERLMTSSPSQSRRENVTRHTNIGCMATIFHFISKYHFRRRFLITSGDKQEANKKRNNYIRKKKCRSNVKNQKKNNSVHKTTKTETEKSLNLLENITSTPYVAAEVEAEAKRRKLVAALEKCDENLKNISNIINALRSNDQISFSSPDPLITVLRHFNPSPSLGIDRSPNVTNAHAMENGMVVQQKKPQSRNEFFEKFISPILNAHTTKVPLWSGKSKIKIIDEVCNDLFWGIDRELGKIVLALEDHVFRYLIDEFIKELIVYLSFPTIYHNFNKRRNARASCTELPFVVPPLPLEACKRRLSF